MIIKVNSGNKETWVILVVITKYSSTVLTSIISFKRLWNGVNNYNCIYCEVNITYSNYNFFLKIFEFCPFFHTH